MRKRIILSLILISSCFNSRAQVTYLESYYEDQGGIEGLYYPNCIVTDSTGQELFITAYNCVTHLATDSTFTDYKFIEKISYSSESFPGLWNAYGISIYNRCFYVRGDHYLNVFFWNESTDSLELVQSFTDNDTTTFGSGTSRKIIIPPDNKNLYLTTSYTGHKEILIFSIDSLTGELTYQRKQDAEDVAWITSGPKNRFIYGSSSSYNDTVVCVYERIFDSDSLALVQKLTANDSLKVPSKIVTSHDGKSIYVCDNNVIDESLLVYDAAEASGVLSFSQKIEINSLIDNFWFASDVILSPDDKYFYMAGMLDLSVFSRDPSTGHLTFLQVIQEGENGFTGFDNISSIYLANDTILYATSEDNDKLLVFRRNPTNGLLTHLKTITNEDGKIKGLRNAVDLVISNDDKNVYTLADAGTDNIGIYNRLQDGKLLFDRVMKWEELGPAIGATYSFEMSPDDKYLFVNSTNMYGIRILKRDPNSGNLLFYKSYTDPGLGLNNPIADATFSHNQQNYYTSTYSNIFTYDVDADSADITFQSILSSDDSESFGLAGIKCIISSGDGKNIYTASNSYFEPDGISVYSRNQTDGSLTIFQTIISDDGLNFSNLRKVLLSPDNRFLYSIGSEINCFERDISDGSLSFLYEISIEDLNISNLYHIFDAAISTDGKSFIGVTRQGKSIISFHRNIETGILTFEQHKYYSDYSSYSNEGPSVCISSDLRNVYLNSQYSDLLAAYELNIPLGLIDITNICNDNTILSVDDDYNCIWSTGESTNTIFIDSEGVYSVYVRDSLGREGWDTTNILFYPKLTVDLGSDTTLQLSGSIYLTADVQGASWIERYFWNDSTELSYNHFTCSDYGIGEHIVSVEVTNEIGCITSDTIIISVVQSNSVGEIFNPDFKVYPNPVIDKIIIETELTGNNAVFTVTNINGKVLISKLLNSKQIVLDISKLPGGVYMGKLINNNTVVVKKIIKR